jgi:hypothetical protein
MIAFASAWHGHTARSSAAAECIRLTLASLGWKDSYAASLLGISPQQLSRQLAGVDPLNFWRFAELPDAFHVEYDRRRAAQRGALVLEPPEVSLIRGAAAMGARRLAKLMTEPFVTRKAG